MRECVRTNGTESWLQKDLPRSRPTDGVRDRSARYMLPCRLDPAFHRTTLRCRLPDEGGLHRGSQFQSINPRLGPSEGCEPENSPASQIASTGCRTPVALRDTTRLLSPPTANRQSAAESHIPDRFPTRL